VNKIYMKMRRNVHRLKNSKKQTGFSMLEAVVVVGVLLALAVGGFLSYGQITENAKIAKVKSTVSEVYTAVMVNQIDGDPTTSAAEVIDRFNESSKKIRVDIRPGESDELLAAMPSETYNPKSGDAFCVTASMIEEEQIFAEMGDCSFPADEDTLPEEPEPTQSPAPVIDHDPIMETTWNTTDPLCRRISLPISGDVNVKMSSPDGSHSTFTNVGKTLHDISFPNAGEHRVILEGTFDKWGGLNWLDNKCLISVDRWGETGTTNLDHAFHNADNLKKVTAIPSTTKNLTAAFKEVGSDFTLGNLNTSSVTNMKDTFNGAVKFKGDISNWDTSEVSHMGWMFYNATEFNSDLSKWKTPNVTTMTYMFYLAKEFNRDLSGWSVAQVTGRNGFDAGATNWILPKPKF
jgi:surface protein